MAEEVTEDVVGVAGVEVRLFTMLGPLKTKPCLRAARILQNACEQVSLLL